MPGVRRKLIAIAAGVLVAIAAHFSWDAWLTLFPIEKTAIGILEIHLRTLVMTGPFTAAVIALLLLGLHIESQALGDQFPKEAARATGPLMPEELSTPISPWHP